jgi:hypothetical protein
MRPQASTSSTSTISSLDGAMPAMGNPSGRMDGIDQLLAANLDQILDGFDQHGE